MMRIASLVSVMIAAISTGASAGSLTHDYHSAELALKATGTGTVAVAVQDKRPRVVNHSRSQHYTGERPGRFSIPGPIFTMSGNRLAEDFADVVSRALGVGGFEVQTVGIAPEPSHEEALAKLVETQAGRLVLITLEAWRCNIYHTVKMSYSVNVEVFDTEGVSLGKSKVEEHLKPIGEGGKKASKKLVPAAYKKVLELLLNDSAIVDGLAE